MHCYCVGRRPRRPISPHPDHYNEVITQPRFSLPSVALSRSLSRLADNDVDGTACQIHAAVCSHKSNSECLQTEFEFKFINQSLNFRTSFNKPMYDHEAMHTAQKVIFMQQPRNIQKCIRYHSQPTLLLSTWESKRVISDCTHPPSFCVAVDPQTTVSERSSHPPLSWHSPISMGIGQ